MYTLGDVCWGLVQEDAIEARALVLGQLLQKDVEAGGVEARQLPPAGVPRGGLPRSRAPVRLLERLDAWDRFHPVARQPTVERQVQTQARFLLAEDAHGLVRCLAS